MTQENLAGFPWRIDEDNADRVVVKNDRGETVHQAEYGDIPTERGAAFVEQTIKLERAFAYAMVGGIQPQRMPKAIEDALNKACQRATSYDRSMIPTTEVLAMLEHVRVAALTRPECGEGV